MFEDLLTEIYEHAAAEAPRESCGLLVEVGAELKYIKCTNEYPGKGNFIISATEYASAEDSGTIKYIVHSHPIGGPEPSTTDKLNIELDDIPWLIVSPQTNTYTVTGPSGFTLPLLGRQYEHGTTDCASILLDYYKTKLNIDLGTYYRENYWWLEGKNYYVENMEKAGFEKVTDGTLKEHDVILMKISSSVDNHSAIYIGNNKILHHPQGRISCEDVYGGWWQKISSAVYRYKGL